MNVEMWHHPAVRSNVEILRSRGHRFVDPKPEVLPAAPGGRRLARVEVIVAEILTAARTSSLLAGRRYWSPPARQ